MKYPDTVQLATTTNDGYGDKTATMLTECKAAFVRRMAVEHDISATGIVSDATVYLDPKNGAVAAKALAEDLKGLYIVYRDNWYSISHVNVAERKLLNNAIDNIYCLLQKESGVAYATYVS